MSVTKIKVWRPKTVFHLPTHYGFRKRPGVPTLFALPIQVWWSKAMWEMSPIVRILQRRSNLIVGIFTIILFFRLVVVRLMVKSFAGFVHTITKYPNRRNVWTNTNQNVAVLVTLIRSRMIPKGIWHLHLIFQFIVNLSFNRYFFTK